MSTTFQDLRNALAIISGQNDYTGFTPADGALADQVINEVYLSAYLPDENKGWPRFGRQRLGFQFRDQQSATINFTKGATLFTGWMPPDPDNMVGSMIMVGRRFYTYAGKDANGDLNVVEPWEEETGPYGATIYHSSYPLGMSAVQFCETPEVMGWGPLSPMSGRESDILYRSNFMDGFRPLPGEGWQRSTTRLFGGSTYDTGQPVFYLIDEDILTPNGDGGIRLNLRPLPEQLTTVSAVVQFVPTPLVNQTDVPRMPADLVARIIIPMIRGRWSMTYKKYTGNNARELVMLSDRAESQLASMRIRQKRRGIRTDISHT